MNENKISECVNPNAPEYFKSSIQELLADMEQLGEKFKKIGEGTSRIVGRRSVPGKGEPVYLTVMMPNEEDYEDDFVYSSNGVEYMTTVNEDYAQCTWPVVLKVKPGTERRFVAKALREYANNIEASGLDDYALVDVNYDFIPNDNGEQRDEFDVPF